MPKDCFVLPDFPRSRKELYEQLLLDLRLRVQGKSPFAALCRQFTQHEGKTFSYEQVLDNDKRTVKDGFEELRTPWQLEVKDIPDLVGPKLFQKIEEIAEDIARQTSQLGYRRLDEATRLAGTAIDAGGQPVTRKLFLKGEKPETGEFNPHTA